MASCFGGVAIGCLGGIGVKLAYDAGRIPPDSTKAPPDDSKVSCGTMVFRTQEIPVTAEKSSAEHVPKVLEAPKFKLWKARVEADKNFAVTEIHFQSVDMFGPKNVGFVKFQMKATAGGKPCPAIVFMRGGAPAILVVLKRSTDGKLFTLTVNQPRIGVGCSSFLEIPAGMLDGDGNLAKVAGKELKEETGLVVGGKDLINMTELVHGKDGGFQGVYSSCGGSDEYNPMFVFRQTVAPDFITKLEGKKTGNADEFEQISLKVIPFEELWKKSGDSKALSALCLYNELLQSGKLPPF